MEIHYEKDNMKDRKLVTSGPRDRQLKQMRSAVAQDQSSLIESLISQISDLKVKLASKQEPVYEDINSSIAEAVVNETKHLNTEIDRLKDKVSSLEDIIKSKDETILALRSNVNVDVSEIKSDRPQIGTVYIDPSEGKTSFEKHVEVENTISVNEEPVSDKLNKLRGILGNKKGL